MTLPPIVAHKVGLVGRLVGPVATIVHAVPDPPGVVGRNDTTVVAVERFIVHAVITIVTIVTTEFLADLLDGLAEFIFEGTAEFLGRVFGEGLTDFGEHRGQHQEHDGVGRATVARHHVDGRAAFFDDDAGIGIAAEANAF